MDNYMPDVIGLSNTDNTCYLNTLLQMLMSCAKINKHMLHIYNDIKPDNDIKLYYAIFVCAYLKNRNLELAKTAMEKALNATRYQCIFEYMTFILDKCDLLDYFKIYTTSTLKCKTCKKTSSKDEYVTFLTNKLYVDEKASKQSILNPHVESVKYTCKCGANDAFKTTIITKLSDYIVFNFSISPTKDYPQHIKIHGDEYMLSCEFLYILIQNIGHYFANVLRKSGIFIVSDSNIKPASWDHKLYSVGILYQKKITDI